MSVQTLFIAYSAWSVVVGIIHASLEEDGFFRSILGAVVLAWLGPATIAWPLAAFLLVDGEWCPGDCWLISAILFPVSLMFLVALVGNALEDREASSLERRIMNGVDERRERSDRSGHGGSRLGWAAVLLLLAFSSPASAELLHTEDPSAADAIGNIFDTVAD